MNTKLLITLLTLTFATASYGWSCKPSTETPFETIFGESGGSDNYEPNVGHTYEEEDIPILCGERTVHIRIIQKAQSIFGEKVTEDYEEKKNKKKWQELLSYAHSFKEHKSAMTCEEDEEYSRRALLAILPGLKHLEKDDSDFKYFHENLSQYRNVTTPEELAGMLHNTWHDLKNRHHNLIQNAYYECESKTCDKYCKSNPAGFCSDALKMKSCGKAPEY